MMFEPGNAQHRGSRPDQQDAFGFTDPYDSVFVRHGGIAAVVADGMGGTENGGAASRSAVQAFLDGYRAKAAAEDVPRALERSIRSANQSVCASAKGGGTTLVAVAVRDSFLHWISAGDSALFLYRQPDVFLLNNSHVYARSLEMAVAAGDIPVQQAMQHPDRECLTSYLGVAEIAAIDQDPEPYRLLAGDRILLASDGLSKVLSLAEIGAAMRGSSQESCDNLLRATMTKNRLDQDNVTIVMLTAMDEPAAPNPTRVLDRPAAPNFWKNLFPRWMQK